jgi:hypothetical protein
MYKKDVYHMKFRRLPGSALSVCALALLAAACASPRQAPVPPALPASGVVSQGGTPSVIITAPSQRVRQLIAARAQQRGTGVASNTARGVVLERPLPQSSEVVEASCGPHQPGRLIRVLLATSEIGVQTQVSESRFIIDGRTICPLRLTEKDVQDANASLDQLRAQAESSPLARR